LALKEIKLAISNEALEQLAREGYNPQYGARPLKRLIQNKILTPVASLIISKGIMKGGEVTVGLKGAELTFEVKKGRGGTLIDREILDQIATPVA
jgi:ATP-dependent Clp protease ATP-binding subunit ClpC